MSNYINDINIFAASSYLELCATAPLSPDGVIEGNLSKAWQTINNPKYKVVLVSISGGSDSDLVIDICTRCDPSLKCVFCYYDTGLEYQATKDHIRFLEDKYQIKIERRRAKVPIPLSCRTYGTPFMNKRVSEYSMRLQNVGFKWEDEPHEVLIKRYCKTPTPTKRAKLQEYYERFGKAPKGWAYLYGDFYRGAVSAINWWCNYSFKGSQCNIENNKWLKEFMVMNPPTFKISALCCKYAKKDVAHDLIKEFSNQNNALSVNGVRKSEGGARAQAYHSCFDTNDKVDNYRPIFWYTNEDKKIYEKAYGITHSECYNPQTYSLCRTGCVGCPCARNTKKELQVVKKFEEKLYQAVQFTFGESYEYERKYREFVKEMKAEAKKRNNLNSVVSEYIFEEKNGQLRLVI